MTTISSQKSKALQQQIQSSGRSETSTTPLQSLTTPRTWEHNNQRAKAAPPANVWIPEMWGQEQFMKDWIDSAAFDSSLVPNGIMLARAALANEGRRRSIPGGARIIDNRW